jgi:hypothetical protein
LEIWKSVDLECFIEGIWAEVKDKSGPSIDSHAVAEGIIFSFPLILLHLPAARVAKLVDALCSGRSVGNHVLVRIQSRARSLSNEVGEAFLFASVVNLFTKASK